MNNINATTNATTNTTTPSNAPNTFEARFNVGAGTFDASGLSYFREYDSQLSVPEVLNTRIIKCLYQVSPKTGKKLRENSYIRIPTQHINEETVVERIQELAPFVVSYLQTVEDSIIKEAHKNGQLNYHLDALSLDSIISLLEESEISGRLNKEMIEAWFMQSIEPKLAELFADKLGLDPLTASELELVKLQRTLNAYKDKFSSLASPKVSFKEADCLALINVIEKADIESSFLGKKFIAKLDSMKNKTEEVLLAL